jgi:hypothetical protein
MQLYEHVGAAALSDSSWCFKPMIRARLTLPNSAITGSTFKFHDGAPTKPTVNFVMTQFTVCAATNYYKSAHPFYF